MKPRQRRLWNEFQLITKIHTEHSLFDFLCGRLTPDDAERIERGSYQPLTWEEIVENMPVSYFYPEKYRARFPNEGPEKYLIRYDCNGMTYKPTPDNHGYELRQGSPFLVEILYGLDFPLERPVFICVTKNVWHPNIRYPHICLVGRPFPSGVTLEYLIPMIGRMFQYQEYNLKSVMNSDAAFWAYLKTGSLPIDDRDILNKHRHLRKKLGSLASSSASASSMRMPDVTSPSTEASPVELVEPFTVSSQESAVELLTENSAIGTPSIDILQHLSTEQLSRDNPSEAIVELLDDEDV